MSRLNKLGLTKEQSKIYRDCYAEAKKYYNLPDGWVLHHKDPELQYRDLDRYIHWLIEDVVPMSKSEHRRFHSLYDNPMNYEENRKKISEAKMGKPVLKLRGANHPRARAIKCLETGKEYPTIHACELDMGFSKPCAHGHISAVCRGKKGQYMGYTFRYIEA